MIELKDMDTGEHKLFAQETEIASWKLCLNHMVAELGSYIEYRILFTLISASNERETCRQPWILACLVAANVSTSSVIL